MSLVNIIIFNFYCVYKNETEKQKKRLNYNYLYLKIDKIAKNIIINYNNIIVLYLNFKYYTLCHKLYRDLNNINTIVLPQRDDDVFKLHTPFAVLQNFGNFYFFIANN